MSYRGKIPRTVNIRVKGFGHGQRRKKRFQLLVRNGKGWDIIEEFSSENKALEAIERHFTNKDAKWSLEVKVKAGWVCEQPGCGELDKKLLESHHIKPKEQFPELRDDPDNGKCLCLFHHAAVHTGWASLAILARGFLILLARRNPHQKTEIERMVV